MSIPEQYKKYQNNAVSGLTGGETVVLLYEHAILNINKAIIFIEDKNIAEAHNSIVKAENIILYLGDTLNMAFPISEKLLSLYDYIYDLLVKANMKKNPEVLEEAIKMLAELKETWEIAEHNSRVSPKIKKCM